MSVGNRFDEPIISLLKREAPVDWVRCGAVSLPIRLSPVMMLIWDPDAPQVEGEPPKMNEKV